MSFGQGKSDYCIQQATRAYRPGNRSKEFNHVVSDMAELEKQAGGKENFMKFLDQYTHPDLDSHIQGVIMNKQRELNKAIKPLRRTKKELEGALSLAHAQIRYVQDALREERDNIANLHREVALLKKSESALKDTVKTLCQALHKVVEV